MPESVPLSLFHTGWAQCPDCGAAVSLEADKPLVHCQYCGGTAVVERRLRTLEPVLAEGFTTADAPVDSARNSRPSQIIDAVAQDESHCPTCGCELAAAESQAIRICPQCGTESKIERRLLRSPAVDEALAAIIQHASDSDRRQFTATEALIVRVEKSTDLADRVRAGWELGEFWIHANAHAASQLPRILLVLHDCDPRLEVPLAELVGKLLCNDNIILANAVLRAAEKVVFDINGSRALLWQLGLGSGIGLKLLLDTADFAAGRGAMGYACYALWAVNTMIDRNFAGRMRLADIVLYRLLYLRGPVQAWAIQLARGQMGLACRFPTPTLLHFMDDCTVERPELLPPLQDCFYDGPARTEAEWRERFRRIDDLFTAPAKAAAIEHIYSPPAEATEASVTDGLNQLLSLCADPELGPSSIKAIAEIITEDSLARDCVHTMLRTHGDQLPEEIRIAYLRRYPGSPLLSPVKPNGYNPAPRARTPLEDQLLQWNSERDQGIRQAVADYQAKRQIADSYWKEIQ